MNREWNKYLFQYYHDDSFWNLEIHATSEEDARLRLNKLPNAQYVGVLQMKVPVVVGFLARIVCWWKNL